MDILTRDWKHNDERIEFLWICGDKQRRMWCNISRFVEPDSNRALGLNWLFSLDHIKRNKRIITVICKLETKKNRVASNEEREAVMPTPHISFRVQADDRVQADMDDWMLAHFIMTEQ